MAFRVIKQRREARRNAKLEEIFLERDKLQNETIGIQDMKDVFRIYGVKGNHSTDLHRIKYFSSSYPSNK